MYVKIRMDGALGIGRGTEGKEEITIGYGEAHMIAAALEKLAQTARSYKQAYKKTTAVGGGNRIDFERTDEGTITISGDGNSYHCTEEEIRKIADLLKHLPPVAVAPASDFVKKITPQNGLCLVVTNGGNQIRLRLAEAALLKTAVAASINSRFYIQQINAHGRTISLQRTSELKWKLVTQEGEVKFTAFEVESLVAGLHMGILEVLMDLVKSFGSDKLADIRVKSQIQRVEKETEELFEDHKKDKGQARHLVKMSKKILGAGMDADTRTESFIEVCNHVYGKMDPKFLDPIFDMFTKLFVTSGS
ncbi:MAG: hypothetical protein ACTSUB_00025 [Candidatus Thorarchaeota archaeon]